MTPDATIFAPNPRPGGPARFADVEAPLATRAEAMVSAARRRSPRHRRGGLTWTDVDEAMFRARLSELHEARARLLRVQLC